MKAFFTKIILSAVILSSAVGLISNPELNSENNNVPDDWQINSYNTSGYAVSVSDNVLTLENEEANDLRVYQDVKVEPKHTYCITAKIKTENIQQGRGASLSIDNYSLDSSCVYSNGILGTSDWQTVTLYFQTVAKQKTVRICFRLGGYGEASIGTAYFKDFTFAEADNYKGTVEVLNPWGSSDASDASSDVENYSEARKIELKSYLHLFIVIAVLFTVIGVFGFYRNRKSIYSLQCDNSTFWKVFIIIALAGLILRSILSAIWRGHDSDMSCWIGWGNYIAQFGTKTFYTASGHDWYDYPPFYMLVLGLISKILSLFQISSGSAAYTFAYMLPAALCDIGIALLFVSYARKQGYNNGVQLFVAFLIIFNPAAVFLSGAWGQIDSILTFMLLGVFMLMHKNRRIWAGILYGLAVMTKWQALIYGPVLAVAFVITIKSWKDVYKTILSVISALAVIFLVSLPFKGEQSVFWIITRFTNATSGYPYASVEAYNFMALIGGNWKNVDTAIFGSLSYRWLGLFAIILFVVISVAFQIRHKNNVDTGSLLMAAALCMFGIYTFGFYMHERYVFPVIFILIAAAMVYKEPRLLLCSLLLSGVVFLNEMSAMYVISDLASSVVRGTREHQDLTYICSLMEVCTFGYFVYILLNMFYKPKEALHAKKI